MESYIRCTIGDRVTMLVENVIRASEAVCYTSDFRVSKKKFNQLSNLPPVALLPSGRGGSNNRKLKINQRQREELGQLYDEIKGDMKDAKADYLRYKNRADWLTRLEDTYKRRLKLQPALLRQILCEIPNCPASDLAIQAAACRVILGYKLFSLSSDRLKRKKITPPS